ncbi:hypothetical protein BpHYR1_025971 [Brachionus plicatilis]|uniref:HAT C-terminal dimerisation domain-containing protein n=1 Tax=Brachionus plicatilis TaxID=10195 RepID=A0A3M7P9F7_BRAPC|nr:hypothetical protein BpHYR1_025971 [Brachionus plicatilis]
MDCIEFWKKNSPKYPILYEFFLVYGGAAASSSPSDRLFSLTGYQVWDRRNKISSERVEFCSLGTMSKFGFILYGTNGIEAINKLITNYSKRNIKI